MGFNPHTRTARAPFEVEAQAGVPGLSASYALTRNSTSGVALGPLGGRRRRKHLLAHGSRLGSRHYQDDGVSGEHPLPESEPPIRSFVGRRVMPSRAGVVGAGILLIALSPGVGWALIVFGGWLAALALQGRTRRSPEQTPDVPPLPGERLLVFGASGGGPSAAAAVFHCRAAAPERPRVGPRRPQRLRDVARPTAGTAKCTASTSAFDCSAQVNQRIGGHESLLLLAGWSGTNRRSSKTLAPIRRYDHSGARKPVGGGVRMGRRGSAPAASNASRRLTALRSAPPWLRCSRAARGRSRRRKPRPRARVGR